jgi:hypothetical protein
MQQYSGMIFERARSFGAQISLAVFSADHFGEKGAEVLKVVRKVFMGPGVFVRRVFAKALPLLFTPLLGWLFTWIYYYYSGSKEVCWGDVVGLRVACKVIQTEPGYSLGLAIRQVYWLMFFFAFEGNSAIVEPSLVVSGCLSLVACVFFFVNQSAFLVLSVSTLLLSCWYIKWRVNIYTRWFMFIEVFFFKGFTVVWLFLEVLRFVFSFESRSIENDTQDSFEVEPLYPSPYLSIALPQSATTLSDGYFQGEPSGMSNEERLMALLGDRFLGVLGARWLQVNGLQVSTVRGIDDLQTDEALLTWVDGLVQSACGKKKRSSFAEVLWGEVYCSLNTGDISFPDVWEAFEVFQRHVAKANNLAMPLE